jgi:hypothetical protein
MLKCIVRNITSHAFYSNTDVTSTCKNKSLVQNKQASKKKKLFVLAFISAVCASKAI